jgi:hypothetical protein
MIPVQSDETGWFRVRTRTMGFNLLWYVPLGVWVVFYFIIPNAVSGFHNVALVFRRFTWSLFFSPSAYVFFGAVFTSIFLPFQLFLMVPAFFDSEVLAYRRPYLWSLCMVITIAISAILLQAIIWGSFPLPADKDDYIHLRMIPFIPWPDMPLFQ